MPYSPVESAVLRTLAFHEAWKYLPTRAELVLTLDAGPDAVSFSREDVYRACDRNIDTGVLKEFGGRIGRVAVFDELFQAIRDRDPLQPRKRRRAQVVARWLARLSGVRFVALANTTAIGNARDEGDLDFFVIVRAGTIWATRLFGIVPFKLRGNVPRLNETRDAVCLSYYIADDHLDLSTHMLPQDDPYFRQWLLALVPLVDDGVSSQFWAANRPVLARHPFAEPWIAPPDVFVPFPRLRIPTASPVESIARVFQRRWFPDAIRRWMNVDTRVRVSDAVLKFHVEDGREAYRSTYYGICRSLGIQP